MANKKISELPAAGSVAGTDELELNQAGTSRKATVSQLPTGVSALEDLSDVEIDAPADNELLAFDSGSSKFINQTPAEAGFGALALKSTIANADIDNDAVTELKIANGQVTSGKIYSASAAVPAPSGGVSTISSYSSGVDFYAATDGTTTVIRLAEPTARRKIWIYNATGNAIDILKDADGSTIRAGVPNRYVIELSNNGAGVWAFFAEFAARLHTHTGEVLQQVELKGAKSTEAAPAISSGTVTLDYSAGNDQFVSLTANVTTIAFSNVPASGRAAMAIWLKQDGTGGRTVAWPASFDWGDPGAPTMPSSANAEMIVGIMTRNGGTEWKAVVGWSD
jgi:hypothetical protein